jgi:tRNA U54 and U55 pseudouridine synthase Pus10
VEKEAGGEVREAGTGGGGEAEDGEGDGQRSITIGRRSVEEVITAAVSAVLGPTAVTKLHPCGREDIDVRCLGNGRPFVLKVSDSRVPATREAVARIRALVNANSGLNEAHDVDLPLLKSAQSGVWNNMQKSAEEKRKGYTCVVWCEGLVTNKLLRR